MNIVVKPMETEEELLGKAYVHWRSWHEAYEGLVPASYLDRLTLEKCEQTARRWPDNLLTAKDGERVVGFAGYGTSRDEDLPETGEVFAIYVLGEYWGKGVGKMLMDAALKKLEQYGAVAVWVLKGNARAIRFYEKCGFLPDGREQAVHLDKPLPMIRMILHR